jgi:eukaryotic-like serine/threonine-protein kinase
VSYHWHVVRFAGRYELRRVIGHGGMGTVYEAEQVFTGQIVALKVITASVRDQDGGPDRFLREARAPSSIGHPAIVTVVDAAHDEHGTPFIAFELVEGESLAAALAGGRLSGADVVDLAIEVLDALDAAHRAGFVHRDIKPQNVMVLRDGQGRARAKLLDFGITRQIDDQDRGAQTATGVILGTPDFMSPEQARGEHADGRADIYGVGAVLFSALTGRPPFAASTLARLIMTIASGDAPPVRSVAAQTPGPLAEVIDRALRSDPKERWESAAKMRDALAACRGCDAVCVVAPLESSALPRPTPSIERLGSEATLPSAPPGIDAPGPDAPPPAAAPELALAVPPARRRMAPIAIALTASIAFAILGGLAAIGVLHLYTPAAHPRSAPALVITPVPAPAGQPAAPVLSAPPAPPRADKPPDPAPAAARSIPAAPVASAPPSAAPPEAQELQTRRPDRVRPRAPIKTATGLGSNHRPACENTCTRRCGMNNSGCLPSGGLPSPEARNACAQRYESCLEQCTCP